MALQLAAKVSELPNRCCPSSQIGSVVNLSALLPARPDFCRRAVETSLDVLITGIPVLSSINVIWRLKLCQIHCIPQQPSNASKPSAELTALL